MPAWLRRLLPDDPLLLRIVGYYALLLGGGALLWRRAPEGALDAFAPAMLAGDGTLSALLRGETPPATAAAAAPPIALEALGAAVAAFALALPVAWTYMLTRERKGYRQSTVHTLVLLPVVVAGVVVLVKSSLALAFSLAGIVAAVRFRNTLDDSKDATFLFLAVGLGLAAGVELDVALVFSVIFNASTLALFYTDFGRTPPAVEGERAKRQLERAMAIANRTSQFVARVDDEVLRTLAPAQLDALATRVRRRRQESGAALPSVPENEYDARLLVETTDASAARALVESVLQERVKRWTPDDGEDADGQLLAYHVRWKKGTPPDAVLDAVQAEATPFVVRAEVA
ncbi:DUF4956 domain-containing protein [Roseisolibacter sp. H3M3-2]|uniref:DUF4956 domain-containing protein n=1 Tax=Roseisolibacter sp. H3M3-2 TaxID=3031323 RepID=UPI0023DA6BA6|nr:DUF4956 domain-containing protein [Roseisolibacter sp. H3M3-2]MDF1502850.1 DUF4956 domain-containing protein [Roseisolibacter sp. H3M3-2]